MEKNNNLKQKPQLHQSHLDQLCRCGEKYHRIHDLGHVEPRPVHLIVGGATHATGARNLLHKVANKGILKSTEEVQDIARDEFSKNWNEAPVVFNTEEKETGIDRVKGMAIDMTINLSTIHGSKLAPMLQPSVDLETGVVGVEKKWVIECSNYPFDLAGMWDVEEMKTSETSPAVIWTIRDLKNLKRNPGQNYAESSDQLTIYAMASYIINQRLLDEIWIDVLVKTKEPYLISYPTARDVRDFEIVKNRIDRAAQIIDKQIYTPANRTDWWCLSMDTEILTKKGWKRYNEFNDQDEVMTLEPISGLLEWQKPSLVFKKEWGKRMIHYNGKSIRFCVTPDHKMLTSSSGGSRERTMTAADIEFKGSLRYPVSAYMYREFKDFNEEIIELSGWLCAEGHFRKSDKIIEITQKKTSKHYKEIKNLLTKLKLKFSINEHESGDAFRILGESAVFVREKIQNTKSIPMWVWDLDSKQFRIWLNALMSGDGHMHRERRWCFSQKDENFIDELQALCITQKISAIKSKERISTTGGKFNSLSIMDGVTNRYPDPRSEKKNWVTDRIDKEVWCVSVPNGFIVTRYEGRPLITGNCSPDYCGFAADSSCMFYCKRPVKFFMNDIKNNNNEEGEQTNVGRKSSIRKISRTKRIISACSEEWNQYASCEANPIIDGTVCDHVGGTCSDSYVGGGAR
jgi:hypothetical protein